MLYRVLTASRLGFVKGLVLLVMREPRGVFLLCFDIVFEFDGFRLPLDRRGEIARLGTGGGERVDTARFFPRRELTGL